MSASSDLYRVLREFRRYTGDGLVDEPVSAPLPVGDPQSGAHSPKKSELRNTFGGLVTEITTEGEMWVDSAAASAAAAAASAAAAIDAAGEPWEGLNEAFGLVGDGNEPTVPENLVRWSQDLSHQPPWDSFGAATFTANNTTAPDATNTGNRVTSIGADGCFYYQGCAVTVGQTLVYSAHVKKGTAAARYFWLWVDGGAGGKDCWFDLDTGTVTAAVDPLVFAATITSLGSGWFRVSGAIIATASSVFPGGQFASVNNANTIAAGSFGYVWGHQLEYGGLTAYVPTTTAPVLISGPTDNSIPLQNFNLWARAESAAGRAVYAKVSPGVYNYDASVSGNWLEGIERLYLHAYGVTWRNVYGGVANFAFDSPLPNPSSPDLREGRGFRINTAPKGATVIGLVSAFEHSNFAVGEWVMVGSLDIQYGGYPPNMDHFDFVRILSIDTGAGFISVEPALAYEHRSDWPDLPTFVTPLCGKARIWKLEGGGFSSLQRWDIEHEYRGMTVLPRSQGYIALSGRKLRFVDCTLSGIAPSVCREFEMIGGVTTTHNEPDKLVASMYCRGVHFPELLAFQSSSIDRVTLQHCTGYVFAGLVKNFIAENCDFYSFSDGNAGGRFGMSRNKVLLNCNVRDMGGFHIGAEGSDAMALTGDHAGAFANGRFTVLKTDFIYWQGIVPGAPIGLGSGGGSLVGNLGLGYIWQLTENSTHVLIDTTLPYATLPSWATRVMIQRVCGFTAINCSGCREIRHASDAQARGVRPWEYRREVFAGACNQNGTLAGLRGVVRKVRINVIKPHTAASSFRIAASSAHKTDNMADTATVVVDHDLTVPGVSIYDEAGIYGPGGGNDVYLGPGLGTALGAMPQDRYWALVDWNFIGLNPATSGLAPWQLPMVEVEIWLDPGSTRWLLPTAVQADGGVIAQVVGDLP